MDFYQAIYEFNLAMQKKFVLRDEKQGDRSVLRRHILDCDMLSVAVHYNEELQELESDPHSQDEMVDVANMTFLRWWWEQEANPQEAP